MDASSMRVLALKVASILGKSEMEIVNTPMIETIEKLVDVVERKDFIYKIYNECGKIDFNRFQELSKRTMPKMVEGQHEIYYDEKAIINYCFGLAGESGEFIDLVKKEMFHGHPENEMKKKKELGDILHYVAGLCTMYGWRMEDVASLNVEKLKERYPEGFSKEDSLNRIDN
jgi:NTP pyrophosphatase (non-canonical NTP hydrolase)